MHSRQVSQAGIAGIPNSYCSQAMQVLQAGLQAWQAGFGGRHVWKALQTRISGMAGRLCIHDRYTLLSSIARMAESNCRQELHAGIVGRYCWHSRHGR
jgi:hypothetical protein